MIKCKYCSYSVIRIDSINSNQDKAEKGIYRQPCVCGETLFEINWEPEKLKFFKKLWLHIKPGAKILTQ